MFEEDGWNLPVAFHFSVRIGLFEVAFKEVSGLDTEMDMETIREGGVNDFEYKVPKQVKHGNLILKRAMLPLTHPVVLWCESVLDNDFSQPIIPVDIKISLLNENRLPIYNWVCSTAYPVKWQVDSLDAGKNSILIETMEFAYSTLKRTFLSI